MVGFQTRMKWPEQKRVFAMIPGLENAVFERYGSVHRNTFVDSPRVLDDELSLIARPGVHIAGQIRGVEGYVESAAGGWLAAWFIAERLEPYQHEFGWHAVWSHEFIYPTAREEAGRSLAAGRPVPGAGVPGAAAGGAAMVSAPASVSVGWTGSIWESVSSTSRTASLSKNGCQRWFAYCFRHR